MAVFTINNENKIKLQETLFSAFIFAWSLIYMFFFYRHHYDTTSKYRSSNEE